MKNVCAWYLKIKYDNPYKIGAWKIFDLNEVPVLLFDSGNIFFKRYWRFGTVVVHYHWQIDWNWYNAVRKEKIMKNLANLQLIYTRLPKRGIPFLYSVSLTKMPSEFHESWLSISSTTLRTEAYWTCLMGTRRLRQSCLRQTPSPFHLFHLHLLTHLLLLWLRY